MMDSRQAHQKGTGAKALLGQPLQTQGQRIPGIGAHIPGQHAQRRAQTAQRQTHHTDDDPFGIFLDHKKASFPAKCVQFLPHFITLSDRIQPRKKLVHIQKLSYNKG